MKTVALPVRPELDELGRDTSTRILAMFKSLVAEIDSMMERDPAARSRLEVVLCYPGFQALVFYRAGHWLWQHDWRLVARALSQAGRWLTGIEIHPGAKIGTFWSYIDARDAATACRLAAEAKIEGHLICNLSHDLSRFREPTAALIAKYLPGTKIRDGFPSRFGGLDNSRAKEKLGFVAKHHWRDYITIDGEAIA